MTGQRNDEQGGALSADLVDRLEDAYANGKTLSTNEMYLLFMSARSTAAVRVELQAARNEAAEWKQAATEQAADEQAWREQFIASENALAAARRILGEMTEYGIRNKYTRRVGCPWSRDDVIRLTSDGIELFEPVQRYCSEWAPLATSSPVPETRDEDGTDD